MVPKLISCINRRRVKNFKVDKLNVKFQPAAAVVNAAINILLLDENQSTVREEGEQSASQGRPLSVSNDSCIATLQPKVVFG